MLYSPFVGYDIDNNCYVFVYCACKFASESAFMLLLTFSFFNFKGVLFLSSSEMRIQTKTSNKICQGFCGEWMNGFGDIAFTINLRVETMFYQTW